MPSTIVEKIFAHASGEKTVSSGDKVWADIDLVAMRYGKLWCRVPEIMKIIVSGKLKEFVTPKDVILRIIKHLGTDGLSYKAVKFEGDTIENLGVDGRITLLSMVTEMDGRIGFIKPNKKVIDFLSKRSGGEIKPVESDEDAEYLDVFELDVSSLEPQVACPHSPDNVKNVREVEGTLVSQVFIGSCTDGSLEDLRVAVGILKGRRVHRDSRLIGTPATAEVAQKALEEGITQVLLNAGAVVTNPSCALCTIGHPGVLASGDVTLSTGNRNYPGKIGKGGEIYLVSPATAAASALFGKITDPWDVSNG